MLYAFISYMSRVVEPLIQITMQFSQLQQAMVAAARVDALLQEARGATGHARAAHRRGSRRLARSDFGYDPAAAGAARREPDRSRRAASSASSATPAAARSTLLSLLLRFYAPQAGRIAIDGMPLDQIGDEHFRADVGLVPQEPFLLAASVRENIDMGRGLAPDASRPRRARAAHADGFISALERGYDTPLGEGGARLSSGQKQLIAIARALAGDRASCSWTKPPRTSTARPSGGCSRRYRTARQRRR